ncbi:MAG: NTPase [Candidatus Atabeyarchaeum deiterrae]
MELKKVNILLTGPPGSGKTRLIQKIVQDLKGSGVNVGGLVTPDVRIGGERTGFHIVDLLTGEKGLMADASYNSDIKVGRYGVNLAVIREIGVSALYRAISKSDIIIIDEIGKMELYSKEFQEAVERAISSAKPLLGTVGERLMHPFVARIKTMAGVQLMTLSRSNWDETYEKIKEIILQSKKM